MPTVLRFGAYRVVIYPNGHLPVHVHVTGPDYEAVFETALSSWRPGFAGELWVASGELTKIAAVLDENAAQLCEAWRGIHGIG